MPAVPKKVHGAACKIRPVAAGFHQLCPDAQWVELVLQGFSKPFQGELGGMIERAERKGDPSANGGNIDDGARLLLPHAWQDGFGDIDQSKEVDIELLPDDLFGCGFEGANGTEPGVVYQYVDGTELTGGFLNGGVNACLVRNVEACEQQVAGRRKL